MERDQEHQTPTPENEKTASAVLKLLAIIGLVAILALAAWMSIQVIRLAPTAFKTVSSAVSSASISLSSIFSRAPENDVEFSLSTSTLSSDEPFTIEWDRETENAEITYLLEYECADGFSLHVVTAGTSTDTICNEPFEFTTVDTSLEIIPVSTSNRFLDVTLTLRALAEDFATGTPQELANDTVTLTVINDNLTDSPATLADNGIGETPETPETPSQTASVADAPTDTTPAVGAPAPVEPVAPRKPTTVYVPNPRVAIDPDGRPDLAVTILGTGVVLDVNDNDSFFPLKKIPTDQRGAVQFEVENVGNNVSKSWDFTAQLPIEGDDDFEFASPKQDPLKPGDKITFTLKFDSVLEDDRGTIKIKLDPGSADRNDANDDATVIVTIEEK